MMHMTVHMQLEIFRLARVHHHITHTPARDAVHEAHSSAHAIAICFVHDCKRIALAAYIILVFDAVFAVLMHFSLQQTTPAKYNNPFKSNRNSFPIPIQSN